MITACGGGGGGGGAIPQAGGGGPVTPQTATVTFTLAIPGRTPGAKGRLPKYVSTNVSWATIVYTPASGGPSGTVQTGCTTNCAATFTAPVGADKFDITLSGPGGDLARGVTTTVVTAGGSNPISMTFNGIVHDATLRMVPSSLPAGTPATALMFVEAHDGGGSTIVPDGVYVDANGSPVTFAIHDRTSNSPFSFNTNGVTAPSTVLPLQYNGAKTLGTTFDLVTSSSLPGPVTGASINVVPTTVYRYPFALPGVFGHEIVSDGGANVFTYADDFPLRVFATHRLADAYARKPSAARITSGTRRVKSPSPGTGGIFACCAGNQASPLTSEDGVSDLALDTANAVLWFGGTGGLAYSSTNGFAQGFAATPSGSEYVERMSIGPDGTVYYTAIDPTAHTGSVGYVSPGSSTTNEFAVPSGSNPIGIAFGHDGNAYFAEQDAGKVGMMTPGSGGTATVTDIALPHANDAPYEVVESPLHDAVFVLGYSNGDPTQTTLWKIGFSSHTAAVHTMAIPAQTCGCGFYRLHANSDLSLWTIDLESGNLVRMDMATRLSASFPVDTTTNVFVEDFALQNDGSVLYVGPNYAGVGKLYW